MKVNLIETIDEYHQASKHYPGRYAEHLPFLDWERQPSPYRLWRGGRSLELPFCQLQGGDLYQKSPEKAEMNIESLGGMLHLAFGLSGKKSFQGTRWELRTNPSSGNLHPTEIQVILGEGEHAGLWHYQPLNHALEERAPLEAGHAEILEQAEMKEGALIGLSSILVRESWKYGVRAFRYCQLDLGHALACLRAAAGLYGWDVWALELPYDKMNALLGYDGVNWPRHEEEEPEILCYLSAKEEAPDPQALLDWPRWNLTAQPEPLTTEHLPWKPNEEVTRLTRRTGKPEVKPLSLWPRTEPIHQGRATELILSRRSGQAYDPRASTLTLRQLEELLAPLVLESGRGNLLDRDLVRLLFLHRVEGLEKGLYHLGRKPDDLSQIRQDLDARFLFEKVDSKLPLYLLERGEAQAFAGQVSCNQKIASQGSLLISFLGPYDQIEEDPACYRELFWQAGLEAQSLYWEAERLGLAGTGIGCYHDDQLHQFLGLKGERLQDLYHFTLGKPLRDERLLDLPPYDENRNLQGQGSLS